MSVRFYAPGSVHHIIARLVDRRFYLNLDGARARYLKLLGESTRLTDWTCLAYALMSNHIHLLMLAGERAPDAWFRRVHPPFATWINHAHEGLGTIFAGRPKMHIVPDDEFSTRIAYIHNNPVRAKVARVAADSAWTSHRAYVGLDAAPAWLDVAEGLRRCGYDDPQAFDRWVQLDTSTKETTQEAERLAQRAARLAHRRGALETCTPILTPEPSIPLAARRYAHLRREPREVIAVIAELLGVPPDVIRSRRHAGTHGRRHVLAAGTAIGLTAAELSAALGITRQSGSRLLRPSTELDHDLVRFATRMLSTDGWSEKTDKGDNERRQPRGKFVNGARKR
jgi:REP element-mobilizing transposase RayT